METNNIRLVPVSQSLDTEIVEWMKAVYEAMDNKEWLAFDTDEELLNIIERGRKYSCLAMDSDNESIAGLFLVNFYNIEDPHFYGHFAGLSPEELKVTAVMDIAMVDPLYRGQSIQKKTMAYSEEKLISAGYRHLLATVHPENIYSYNNLLKSGFNVCARKKLYEGLDRLILKKDL